MVRRIPKVARQFLAKLAADNYHLKTGFLGTPWLLPALTSINRSDLAMRLLLNEDYPSWGFEIKMGATTMWERWNSIHANGEFGPVEMNSFNHYAYGAVADWMFAHLGGIQILEPGYKKSRIAPLVKESGLDHADCSIHTPYGQLACHWMIADNTLSLTAIIPPNTTADIVIPTSSTGSVLEGGEPISSSNGIIEAKASDKELTVTVGSGSYKFSAPIAP